ncbi:hypothetical protein Apa02nite_029120 [Actinoplanes palleronii]|uniref:Uncharacterized protein n=2 Tax=Actinoplanes palleronii TaxID=113570 RepID=A0ABQ4B815_9ACTN|nr:hypothetical protein Apa02nite_029120 [Actinoplanes palleronii]
MQNMGADMSSKKLGRFVGLVLALAVAIGGLGFAGASDEVAGTSAVLYHTLESVWG